MARLAHAMTMESNRVTADVIQAQEFPYLARMHAVHAVPKTVINNMVEVLGAVPEQTLLQKMLVAVGQEELLAEVGQPSLADAPGGGPTTLLER